MADFDGTSQSQKPGPKDTGDRAVARPNRDKEPTKAQEVADSDPRKLKEKDKDNASDSSVRTGPKPVIIVGDVAAQPTDERSTEASTHRQNSHVVSQSQSRAKSSKPQEGRVGFVRQSDARQDGEDSGDRLTDADSVGEDALSSAPTLRVQLPIVVSDANPQDEDIDTDEESPTSAPSQPVGPAVRALRNPNLGRTLRMDLKNEVADGDFAAEIVPPGRVGNDLKPLVLPTHRIGEGDDADFVAGRRSLSMTNPMGSQFPGSEAGGFNSGSDEPRIQFREYPGGGPFAAGPSRRPGGFDGMGTMPGTGAPDWPSTRQRSSRAPRQGRGLGERTIVIERRGSQLKDRRFLAALAAAVTLTAALVLYFQSGSSEIPTDIEEAPSDDLYGTRPSSLGSGMRSTELRSTPAGAEVSVGGAVIGNTPVRVSRTSTDTDYVLRLPGYEPKTVRVGMNSNDSISATLFPNNGSAAATP